MKKAVIIPAEYLIKAQQWLFDKGYCWCMGREEIITEFNKDYEEISFDITNINSMEYCYTEYYASKGYEIIKFEKFFKEKFRKNKIIILL